MQHTTSLAPPAVAARRPLAHPDVRLAYLLNLPMLAVLAVTVAFPVGYSFWVSLQSYNLRRPQAIRFTGLENYITVLGSEEFWTSLRVTLIFTVGSVITELIIGMLLALLLNERFVGRGLLRSLILLPWAIPSVVGGIMWQWVFNPRFGLLNGALYSTYIINDYQPFLLDPVFAMLALIFAYTWNAVPFTVLVLLAALQAIPRELYEAAQVDGAGLIDRFRSITLPWLTQPLMIIMIVATMGSLRVFDLVYVITGGGPGDSTRVVTFTAYKKAFDALDFGTANAYAYILAMITLLFGVIYLRGMWQRGEIDT